MQPGRLLDKHKVGCIENRGVTLLENPPLAGIGPRFEDGPEAAACIERTHRLESCFYRSRVVGVIINNRDPIWLAPYLLAAADALEISECFLDSSWVQTEFVGQGDHGQGVTQVMCSRQRGVEARLKPLWPGNIEAGSTNAIFRHFHPNLCPLLQTVGDKPTAGLSTQSGGPRVVSIGY